VSSAPVAFQGTQLSSIVQPLSGERAWTQPGSGNWNDIQNWYYWGRPDTNEEIANFGSAVLTSSTVTINEAVTMKGMRFQSDQQYTLSGSGGITIASGTGSGTIAVQRGAHQTLVSLTMITLPDSMCVDSAQRNCEILSSRSISESIGSSRAQAFFLMFRTM
jgi:hypothetical protein